METVYGNGGSRLVVTELSHIKDLAMQLQEHLDGPHLRPEAVCRLCHAKPPQQRLRRAFQVHEEEENDDEASGEGEGVWPVDDGHSWRKYGQKPILGGKYPRSYYRCRHRHSQGCKAMKKVQRANEDPTLFDVMYFGTHTCVERTEAAAAVQLAVPAREHDPDAHCLLQSLSGSLTVKTEGLAAATEPEPQCLNATCTTPFCPSSASPVSWFLSPDIADEFIDIDVISSFFE
ncbi:hypothetical protein QOZ80_6AG0532590 [Eleusine coracana subsp. coracana]|nr:hypothetical protein QOZ80_6AG0532590 [Eleusine coracana subsp. coracana]